LPKNTGFSQKTKQTKQTKKTSRRQLLKKHMFLSPFCFGHLGPLTVTFDNRPIQSNATSMEGGCGEELHGIG